MTPMTGRPGRRPSPAIQLLVTSILLASAAVWAGAATPPKGGRKNAPVHHEPSKPGMSTVEIAVAGQGMPVPGVRITVAPDSGGEPELWNSTRSQPLGDQRTDSTGKATFTNVPPGKYIVTTGCMFPGNWIAGNYATRIETLPNHVTNVVLTARRGGMVRGRAVLGDGAALPCDVRTESPDALMSGCGMMTPTVVDSNGAFSVSKIPLNAIVWVKAMMPFNDGQLGVWKSFRMDKADTTDSNFNFPKFAANELGNATLRVRMAEGNGNVDPGHAQLLMVRPDGTWRYEINFIVGGSDSVTTLKNIPAGDYQVRASPDAGAKVWWTAPIESLTVLPGKTATHTLPAKPRT